MENLEQKYADDTLRPEELDSLRKKVNAMEDEEIALMIREEWMNEEIDTSKVEDDHICKLKKKIDSQVGFIPRTSLLFSKVARIAAAILIPVLILSTLYFYNESEMRQEEEMLVSTGRGERANIILPDGSKVMLNSQSRLSYMPVNYNKKERQVHFEGEAYFQVSKNKACPFLIDAKGLTVKVLGTIFNLRVRDTSNKSELTLEEGSVLLSSVRTGKSVILKPNQKAVLNQVDGEITVVRDEAVQQASAWKHGDMIFKNTPLANVLESIQENYGVEFRIEGKDQPSDDSFTGTITTSDLNEVLDVLEKIYHLKAIVKGKIVYLNRAD